MFRGCSTTLDVTIHVLIGGMCFPHVAFSLNAPAGLSPLTKKYPLCITTQLYKKYKK